MVEKVTIIGSGPSAYQAYLYLEDLDPLLIEGSIVGNNGPGGQLTTTTEVDNYPCHVKIDGNALVEAFQTHCKLDIKKERVLSENAEDIVKENEYFIVKTSNAEVKTQSILISTGSSAKRLEVEGSDTFWMKGISSCAICDGFAFLNKVVTVVGGGDSAMEEVQYLSTICKKIYLIHRRMEFRSRKDNLEKIKKLKNVQFILNSVISKITNQMEDYEVINPQDETDNLLKNTSFIGGLIIENVETKQKTFLKTDGLFYAIGHNPNSWFVKNIGVNLTEEGNIITDENKCTNVEGVYSAGDVQDKKYKQANTAASSGCVAALNLRAYLKNKDLI
ncbi:hypothetical protein H312_02515 [Anncaliia algerae PRA339]|uniref:FAD/NAD(P)-binding domain-containing protein n=1 Tax=Anncaliia algerae PRA339 TaxID=1288291 RepID=A0A059EYX1_9MICR|nr:hypothetical protein H312_02515 [Anncaliia algerae PRA339]